MSVGRAGLAGSGDRDHVTLPSEICKIQLERIRFPSSAWNDPEMSNMQKILCRSAGYSYFQKGSGEEEENRKSVLGYTKNRRGLCHHWLILPAVYLRCVPVCPTGPLTHWGFMGVWAPKTKDDRITDWPTFTYQTLNRESNTQNKTPPLSSLSLPSHQLLLLLPP